MAIIIAIVTIVLDRISKIYAFNNLRNGKTIDIIPGLFDFSYVENRGAAFGIFQGRTLILAAVSVIFIAFLVYMYVKSGSKNKVYSLSVGLIVAGALGNLYDRVFIKYVVDFIHVFYKDYHFPTFNVADVAIVIGTALMFIYYMFLEEKDKTKNKKDKSKSD